jgi:hypothetical protein
MDFDIIKNIKETDDFSYELSFSLALHCAKLLTGSDTDRAIVYRAVIHILNKWDRIPTPTYPLWSDIIEAIGFYPYITKNADTINITSFADEVRQKSYLSDYLPNIYMHREQKKLSEYLNSDKNVVASTPTSFGKSLLIEELVASHKFKNIVIIQPTLALLDETRLKLKKYDYIYKIIVRTSQDPSDNKGNLFLFTAERVMEYTNFSTINLLIIDEFYKMSLNRVDERADTLNNAFLKIFDSFKPKFYLLGPNIDNITQGFTKKYNAVFYKTDYSLVDCDVKFITTEKRESSRRKKLFELLDEQASQQTLIYCSAPTRARELARKYLKYLKDKNVNANTNLPIIEWLDATIPKWTLTESLSYGIAIHDGSLPKHLGTSIIRYFNERKIRCIFCTSTIIEGVNTSAKNVIIFDGKKGTKEIDYFDFNNIKSRSGRFMEHYLGMVYCFTQEPKKKSIVIDIPFYEQDADVLTSEILVNIQDKDVQPQVRQRYTEINAIEPELLKILKSNGTKIEGQIKIYNRLDRELKSQYLKIYWNQMPTYEQILYLLQICENNCFSLDKSRGVRSVKQLAVILNKYRFHKNLNVIIQDIYNHSIGKLIYQTEQKEVEHYDRAIETAFHIYRHWLQFTIPKTFRVVDNLQRYVCEKNGYKAGSYSYFVQQLENDFVQKNLSILIEYGIPSETVNKLEHNIPDDLSEDDVIKHIKLYKNKLLDPLMQYERDRLEQCL